MGYGQNLKKALKERNMTVKELARLCNINPSTLYTCINRDSSVRYDMALPIANTLDIDVNLICKDNPFRGDDEMPPLLWEAGGLLTDKNKRGYMQNQLFPLINLYDYKDFPHVYRLLANFYLLSDKGREQIIDILEGAKLRHVDSERSDALKELKKQN